MRASGINKHSRMAPYPNAETYSHGPCAVIAEPRRLASKPFEQNRAKPLPEEPPRAITGCRSRCFHNRLLKLPPGPLSHGACAVVRAKFCLSAPASGDGGTFKETRPCKLGDFIGIGWKGTRISGNEILLAMKKTAI